VEAEEGLSARDGDCEWRRWRDSWVAWLGEWRMGGGDSGGEDGGGGAVMRVIGGESGRGGEWEAAGSGNVECQPKMSGIIWASTSQKAWVIWAYDQHGNRAHIIYAHRFNIFQAHLFSRICFRPIEQLSPNGNKWQTQVHDTIDIWICSKQVAWKIHASMILMHGTMAGISTCSKQNRAEQRRGTFQNGLSAWLFLDMPITHEILIITNGLARVQRAYLHVKSIK
jgi:hypothetical protein